MTVSKGTQQKMKRRNNGREATKNLIALSTFGLGFKGWIKGQFAHLCMTPLCSASNAVCYFCCRDPMYLEYLDKIGQHFFGVPPPQRAQPGGGMFSGIFDSLLSAFNDDDDDEGDEGGSAAPTPSTSSTAKMSSEDLDWICLVFKVLLYNLSMALLSHRWTLSSDIKLVQVCWKSKNKYFNFISKLCFIYSNQQFIMRSKNEYFLLTRLCTIFILLASFVTTINWFFIWQVETGCGMAWSKWIKPTSAFSLTRPAGEFCQDIWNYTKISTTNDDFYQLERRLLSSEVE